MSKFKDSFVVIAIIVLLVVIMTSLTVQDALIKLCMIRKQK